MKSAATVLILDKDKRWRNFTKRVLEEDGYRVKTIWKANNLGKTLSQKRFNVVFVDLNYLPEVGSSQMNELRKRVKGKHIVVFHQPIPWPKSLEGMRKAFKSGAEDWVEKSFVKSKIVGVLENIFER